MDHSSTLLHGNYQYLTFTLLNRSCASDAICCKIALNWLKFQKAKVPLRHPKKGWPPISIEIGQMKAKIPNFHLKQLLSTFFMPNSFISKFKSWVPSWCVSANAHSRSHFYNYDDSMDVFFILFLFNLSITLENKGSFQYFSSVFL